MKKVILLLVFFGSFCFSKKVSAQPISNMFYAENYWQPNFGPFTGQLQTWWTQIQQSGVKYMRVGGINYDGPNMWSNSNIITIIDEIRGKNIEPIIQVPIDVNKPIAQNALDAANLVTWINGPPNNKNIKYWEIGNEPHDHYIGVFNYTSSGQIASYIKQVSTAMKGVAGQLGIKIIGPSLSYYEFNYYNAFFTPLGPDDITGSGANGYYIDYISFHTYPFDVAGLQSLTARQDIIDNIQLPFKYKDILDIINSKIPPGRIGNLKIMVTEANLGAKQDITSAATKGISGVGPGSFLAGQYWAELAAVSMEKGVETLAFWSAIEGTGTTPSFWDTDIGYIGAESQKRRSSYWHYKMLTDHFTGTFYPATVINEIGVGPAANVKAFAARSGDRVAVMIMNQRTTGSLPFKVRLDGNGTSPASGLDISFGISNTLVNLNAGHVSTFDIANQSTVLLIFNCKGTISQRLDYSLLNNIADQAPQPTNFPTQLIGSMISWAGAPIPSQGSGSVLFSPPSYQWAWQVPPCATPISGNNVTLMNCMCPTGPTIYTFTAKDGLGCETTQQFQILCTGALIGYPTGCQFYAEILAGDITPSSCNAKTGGVVFTPKPAASGYTSKWDNSPVFVAGTSTTGLAVGGHTVTIKQPPGCNGTITYYFYIPSVGSLPVVLAGPDQNVNRSCLTTLVATPDLTSSGHTYEWFQGNSTIPFSNSRVTTFNPWSTVSCKAVVTSPAGCKNSDVMIVNTKSPRCLPSSTLVVSAFPCPPVTTSAKISSPPVEQINGAVTINTDQIIDHSFKVHNGGVLSIKDCELVFAEGTGIEVQPGGQLIIIRTWLHPCAGSTWNGILAKGNNNDSGQLYIEGSLIMGAAQLITTDKTREIYLNNNTFMNATTALVLERNKDFKITRNIFYNLETGIKTINTPIADLKSLILENIFRDVKIAISFDSDNHSRLQVECNAFENYTDYAIYSDNTILQDQGTITQGAANTFTSSSTMVNHKLKHNGNAMKYYYDPSIPMTLITGSGLNAIAQAAAADGNCVVTSARLGNSGNSDIYQSDLSNVHLYPNPFNNSFTIISDAVGTIEVYNGVGSLIYSKNMEETKTEIDLSKESSGIYFIRINNAKGSVFKKIIKE